jgi:hypothetical protein
LQGNGIVRFTRLQIQRQLSALLPKRINRLRVVQGGLLMDAQLRYDMSAVTGLAAGLLQPGRGWKPRPRKRSRRCWLLAS